MQEKYKLFFLIVRKQKLEGVVISIRATEEEVAVALDKKTSAQKIRDYFKTTKWHALTKKQQERGKYKSK